MTQPFSTLCPHCGRENDCTSQAFSRDGSAPREQQPTDGQAAMCAGCGQWAVFDNREAGGLRKPSAKERRALAAHPLAAAMSRAWEEFYGAMAHGRLGRAKVEPQND